MPSDGPRDHETRDKRPPVATRSKTGRKTNPQGRGRGKELAAILQNALDEPAAAEGGRRHRTSKREVVIRRLVEKSAGADLAATKLLFELLRKADIEARAGAPADIEPFSQNALDQLKERLARLAAAAAAAPATSSSDPLPPDPAKTPDSRDDAAGEEIGAEGRRPP